MFGLSGLGVVHTLISLVALLTGAIVLIRDREISLRSAVGKTYVAATVLTCLTGFGFFYLGSGFSKGQILGIVTLLAIAIAILAGNRVFGRASAAVETVSYSATFLFNMIPGVTQATTRFPPSAPLFPNDEAPQLGVINLVLLLLFLVGAVLQVRRLRHRG